MKKIAIKISALMLVGSLAGCGTVNAARKKPGRFIVGAAAGVVDGPGPTFVEMIAREGTRNLNGGVMPYHHKVADALRVLHWGGLAASVILIPPVAIGWAAFSALIGGTYRADSGWTRWRPVKADGVGR